MNWKNHPWAGVFPATLCALREDESVDPDGLAEYFAQLAAIDGMKGLTCNGHTGEIMSLRPAERAEVTHILGTNRSGSVASYRAATSKQFPAYPQKEASKLSTMPWPPSKPGPMPFC